MFKINSTARLKASEQVRAASPKSKKELDLVMKSLTTVLGNSYKSEKHDGLEDVYWEFDEKNSRGGGDHVLFSIMYNPSTDAMSFEFAGEDIDYTSKPCRGAGELLQGLHFWARSKHSSSKTELSVLSKLSRVVAER